MARDVEWHETLKSVLTQISITCKTVNVLELVCEFLSAKLGRLGGEFDDIRISDYCFVVWDKVHDAFGER